MDYYEIDYRRIEKDLNEFTNEISTKDYTISVDVALSEKSISRYFMFDIENANGYMAQTRVFRTSDHGVYYERHLNIKTFRLDHMQPWEDENGIVKAAKKYLLSELPDMVEEADEDEKEWEKM